MPVACALLSEPIVSEVMRCTAAMRERFTFPSRRSWTCSVNRIFPAGKVQKIGDPQDFGDPGQRLPTLVLGILKGFLQLAEPFDVALELFLLHAIQIRTIEDGIELAGAAEMSLDEVISLINPGRLPEIA